LRHKINDDEKVFTVAVGFKINYNLTDETSFTDETEHQTLSIKIASKQLKMIAHLSGKLLLKQATTVIVDVGGVGYEVTIPLSTAYELGEIGSDVALRIYTLVREDALQLFGFQSGRERELFTLLISVSGIGAKRRNA
jgi:hypothetical protein